MAEHRILQTIQGATPRPPEIFRTGDFAGLPLLVFPDQQEPVFSLEMNLPAGRFHQTRPLEATVALNMLREGTRGLDASAVGRELDRLGIWLELEVGWHFSTVRILGHNSVFEPALELFRSIMLEPAFPETELRRLRKEYAERMKVSLQQNAVVGEREFRAMLFGAEHVYGQKPEPSDYTKLERDQLLQWWSMATGTPGMLILTGTPELKRSKALGQLGRDLPRILNWRSISEQPVASSDGRALGTLENGGPAHAVHLHGPGAHQSSVEIGRVVPARTHTDAFGLHLLTTILGGYFGSRLMASVREEGGLTYGIYSGMHHLLKGSYLRIHCETGPEHVQEVFDRVVQELENLRTSRVGPEELYKVRQYIMGESRFSLETVQDHAQKYRSLINGGVSPDWFLGYLAYVDRADPDELQDLAIKYLDPEQMIFLHCGTGQTKIF